MKKTLITLAALASILSSTQVSAQTYITGKQLVEMCSQGQSLPMTYVTAVAETSYLTKRGKFCPKPGVTMAEIKDYVCGWLKEHPDHLDKPAALLTEVAMGTAWPCPQ